MKPTKRIALLGMLLEANAFSPVSTEADFRSRSYLEGDALWQEATREVSSLPQEFVGFVRAMDTTGEWTPVPILLTECEPGGPVEQRFFEQTLQRMLDGLRKAAPVDGVFIANHGAMTATKTTDPDGEMFEAIRSVVGDDVPIVVTLDLHANISQRMVKCSDMIIGYLTNPHVDMLERGEEAAFAMRQLLAGTRAEQVLIRLPLTPPSVTLLTADGPYADLIDFGQRRRREYAGSILNVSIFGGFVFSDTPENGIAVVISGRNERAPAAELAGEIAERAWNNRDQFKKSLTNIDDAVEIARSSSNNEESKPVIFSDAGDNPGGGGLCNTLWLLEALVDSGVSDVLYGSFFDRALAAEAHARGLGAQFEATFNRNCETEFSKRASMRAKVVALQEGKVVGRRGIYSGRRLDLGPCCALALGDDQAVIAIIISERLQTADPVFFEQFGIDIGSAQVVCVKSRGHFRAGFDLWFAPDQVYEVDTLGLTSPVLSRFEWKSLPRPVYPLDPQTRWNLDQSQITS